MRFLSLAILATLASTVAAADYTIVTPRVSAVICTGGDCAQAHATIIARRGVLVHSGSGHVEGIGTGPTPQAARKNCCFFGTRPIIDEGVAWSPLRRRWFAVIRYR